VREAWEETSLAIEPETLVDLGPHDYLPAKQLHLFGLRVAVNAVQMHECRCHTSFPHRVSSVPTLEVDAYAWKPLDRLGEWCGKNMTRVLLALDWAPIERLPEVAVVPSRKP
jgi:putative (di)nucleoside polyphosphate hydrolase